MTHDEAEKLARNVLRFLPQLHSSSYPWYGQVQSLANSILSGSMKREIENAAYAQVASRLDARAQNYRDTATKATSDPETIPLLEAAAVASENGAEQIRALIQPPAQKENGE